LLREPRRVGCHSPALCGTVKIKFTVKTRIGFESPKFSVNCCGSLRNTRWTCWSSTAARFARCIAGTVHYECITRAVAEVPCPVLANGNVHSARNASRRSSEITGARGLMIGRGAIRIPGCSAKSASISAAKPFSSPRIRGAGIRACALRSGLVAGSARIGAGGENEKYMNYLGMGH